MTKPVTFICISSGAQCGAGGTISVGKKTVHYHRNAAGTVPHEGEGEVYVNTTFGTPCNLEPKPPAVQEVSSSSSTRKRRPSTRLPLESITWVGDQWFLPDGYRVYTPREMRDFFSRHSSVWIGDSTIRRAYLTLHALMMTADPEHPPVAVKHLESRSLMNVNKVGVNGRNNQEEACQRYANNTFDPIDGRSLICRTTTSRNVDNNKNSSSSAFMTYLGEGCALPTTHFLDGKAKELFQNYSIVIISTGLYDAVGRCERRNGSIEDRENKRRARIPSLATHVMRALSRFISKSRTNRTTTAPHQQQQVLYRTSGHQMDGESEDMIELMNQHMLTLSSSSAIDEEEKNNDLSQQQQRNAILSVDWGTAVKSRSFGENRIAGDNGFHYGHSARILFLQMLMNRLVEDLEARGEDAFPATTLDD